MVMHLDAKEWKLALGSQPPRRVRCVKITYKGNLPGTTEHVEQKSALGFLLAGYEGDSDEEIAVDLESIHSDEELYDELQETLSSHVCVSMQVFPLYTRTHSL